MRVRSLLAGLVLGASLTMAPGCSVFQSACSKALPTLVAAQSYSYEAQGALDAARKAIESSSLSDAAKANAFSAIDKAQAGLQAASKTLAAASTTCSQPDIGQVFEAFVLAWDSVREFLALVGDGGVAPVADPSVYVELRGAQ